MAEIMDFWHDPAAKAVPNASQTFFFDNSATSRPVEAPPLPAGGSFSIPAHLRDLQVADLPLSGRLVRVLDRIGVVRLGDVHGLSFRDMQSARNCGPGTVLELVKFIERAAKAQYGEPKVSCDSAELVRTIDGIIEDLPSRDKDMLLLRLGGRGEEGLTLSETGTLYQVSRERVRQVVNRCMERIRTGGSPRLQTYLAYVEEVCRKKVCPLTPALLRQWFENSGATGRLNFTFYVSVLGELEPAIPAWPAGQVPSIRPTRWSNRIKSGLETVLLAEAAGMPLSKALSQVQKLGGCEKIRAAEFLAVLHHSRRFKVEFPQPDTPMVRLAWLRPVNMAKAVLQESRKILTLEQIIERAQSKFGPEAAGLNPPALAYWLTEERGFYLFGRRAFGLRRHFSAPQRLWKQIQKDFRKLLKKENHPISTSSVARSRLFKWAGRINSYELACILRQDAGLIDLGRFLFALPQWRIKQREFIPDLITRVLEKAGQPLTRRELLRELCQLRSISSGSVANGLRLNPHVQDFGCGRYGLKSWGKRVKDSGARTS